MTPRPRPEPYDPLRKGLYTPGELMVGYARTNPEGALDRRIARHFLATGGRTPASAAEAIAQRLHDFGIDQALSMLLSGAGGPPPRVVGVMGSHSARRDDPRYAQVVEVGWRLGRAGYLVVTGGGPGMMEAANLGAYLSRSDDIGVISTALKILAVAPSFSIDHGAYVEASQRVLGEFPAGAESLGIPTWVYPNEPVNLFSTGIAKYFSNSVREEGLIAIGEYGVVFVSDSPGTAREAFQAAEQNSYWVGERRSPMVVLGAPRISWFELLRSYALRDGYADLVAAFGEPAQVVEFIVRTPPLARPPHVSTETGGGARRARVPRH